MRQLIRVACFLVLMVTLQRGASAQAQDNGADSLQLQLDPAGASVVTSPLRTADGHTMHEMQLRVRRSRNGLIGSSVLFGVGAALMIAGGATMASASPSNGLERAGRRLGQTQGQTGTRN